MAAPSTAFKSLSNPLQDDELSDLTKEEIIFWSKKLRVTPSELFTLTKEELDILLNNFIQEENDKNEHEDHEENEEQKEKLNEVKQQQMGNKQKSRLKGGACNDLLAILARAARDIERIYNKESSYEDYDPSEDVFGYDTTYSDNESTFDSTLEDLSFHANQDLHSTPICPAAANRTYNVPNANATYNVSPRNATFNCNKANTTYSCPSTSYNLSSVTPPSGYVSSPPTTDSWGPQQCACIADSSADKSNSQSFRNYTDYSIKYGPSGTEEASSSISVENYDETSGQVTASSRTFTLPPATSATNAIMLSKISPPHLSSGVCPRAGRVPRHLAAGCMRRSSGSANLSNVSAPPLASGARRARTSSPPYSDGSNMTPINLASGCLQSEYQLADISQPQLASGVSAADTSYNLDDITPPVEMAAANRCALLSAALRDKTPIRYKPNRPYCPRRIC